MARNLTRITQDYWAVSHALRHPQAKPLACGDALRQLNSDVKLRPTDWRLKDLMHVVRYTIIEGNTTWQGPRKQQVAGSILTLPTNR